MMRQLSCVCFIRVCVHTHRVGARVRGGGVVELIILFCVLGMFGFTEDARTSSLVHFCH